MVLSLWVLFTTRTFIVLFLRFVVTQEFFIYKLQLKFSLYKININFIDSNDSQVYMDKYLLDNILMEFFHLQMAPKQ